MPGARRRRSSSSSSSDSGSSNDSSDSDSSGSGSSSEEENFQMPFWYYKRIRGDKGSHRAHVEFVFEGLRIEDYCGGRPVDLLISDETLEYWPISKSRALLQREPLPVVFLLQPKTRQFVLKLASQEVAARFRELNRYRDPATWERIRERRKPGIRQPIQVTEESLRDEQQEPRPSGAQARQQSPVPPPPPRPPPPSQKRITVKAKQAEPPHVQSDDDEGEAKPDEAAADERGDQGDGRMSFRKSQSLIRELRSGRQLASPSATAVGSSPAPPPATLSLTPSIRHGKRNATTLSPEAASERDEEQPISSIRSVSRAPKRRASQAQQPPASPWLREDADGDLILMMTDDRYARVSERRLRREVRAFDSLLPEDLGRLPVNDLDGRPIFPVDRPSDAIELLLTCALDATAATRETYSLDQAKTLLDFSAPDSYDAPRAFAVGLSQLFQHASDQAPTVFAIAAHHGLLGAARAALSHFGSRLSYQQAGALWYPNGKGDSLAELPLELAKGIPPAARQSFDRLYVRAGQPVRSTRSGTAPRNPWSELAESFELA